MAKKSGRTKLRCLNRGARESLIITKKDNAIISVKRTLVNVAANVSVQQRELRIGCFSRGYLDTFNTSLASLAAGMVDKPLDCDVTENGIEDGFVSDIASFK